MKHAATALGWIATLGLGGLLGWLAAQVRLLDSPWAVAALVLVYVVVGGYLVHGYMHLWDEEDD